LVGAALGVGMFYGCQKDLQTSDPILFNNAKSIEDKLLIDEAKIYFESRLDELRKQKEINKNKLKVTTDAAFDGLDVNPKWDNAKITRQNGSFFVETPYEFEGNQQFGLSISKNAQIAPEEKSVSWLIVKKNKDGIKSANFMSVSADDEYLNGNNISLKNFSYQSVPNKFKGNQMHFNIDGSFKNGWHFSDGKANGIIKKTQAGILGTRDDCYERFCQEHIKYIRTSITVGGYKTTTIYQTCDYQLRDLICNGWLSPNELFSNDNNTWVDTDIDDPSSNELDPNEKCHNKVGLFATETVGTYDHTPWARIEFTGRITQLDLKVGTYTSPAIETHLYHYIPTAYTFTSNTAEFENEFDESSCQRHISIGYYGNFTQTWLDEIGTPVGNAKVNSTATYNWGTWVHDWYFN
jgi:hypothetical protein